MLFTAQLGAWLYACMWDVKLGMEVATGLLLAWLWFMANTSKNNAAGGF